MTISDQQFLELAKRRAERDLLDPNNLAQLEAATYAGGSVLQIVAGPGSGKTTVIVLRALRHVFVEGVRPENILITTFTRKAAKELRTRWLEWGDAILGEVKSDDRPDLNKCMIDTLDSVAHRVLSDNRPTGELSPIIAEVPASLVTLRRVAFGNVYNDPNKDVLDEYLRCHTFDGGKPRNRGDALSVTKRLLERLVQDRVGLGSYRNAGKAQELVAEMLESYREHADETGVFDFALLEEKFLQRLANGGLDEWINPLKAVLIDEYQDTNPLQEAIYFKIFKKDGLRAAIVCDDDQAMYRFRGGSVELFTDFSRRCERIAGRRTKRVDMVRNFRSTPEIVEFYNSHILTDPKFACARISPSKPPVAPVRKSGGIPVLGMFRPDEKTLATDLADFIGELVKQRRFAIGDTGKEIVLSPDGALGDIAFLSHSVNETTYDRWDGEVERRFPSLFREKLESRGLGVFNPRGQALRTIPEVQKLLGLLLLAIGYYSMPVLGENSSDDEDGIFLSREARSFLDEWADIANQFASPSPPPDDGRGIRGFIEDWWAASSGEILKGFPGEYPALELLYKMLAWLPDFQHDRERQAWLEAVARVIASASMASPYRMRIRQNTKDGDAGEHVLRSRFSLIRDALVPIAENRQIDADEDLIPNVPRDRLPFMTIHQAKGLEFPLVIVDVGSRFKTDHWTQRFLRFPDKNKPSNAVRAEEDMERHLPSPLRGGRLAAERDFDDLVRLYYVAYSRPQSALILVGNSELLGPKIPNAALGWRRDGTRAWGKARTANAQTEYPFMEI